MFLLQALGLLLALRLAWRWGSYAIAYFFPRRTLASFGEWAVITGATDGIGKAYAQELAQSNSMHLLLIGRDATKLKTLATELQEIKGFNRTIETCQMDFAKGEYISVREKLVGKDVGMLINNVGLSYPGAMYYHQIENKFIDELIDVNIKSTMHMTHLVYGGMRSRKRGAIICLGSASSVVAEPLLVGYAACKGAIEGFCRSLQAECRDSNILVQCQIPLFVATKMARVRKPTLTIPSARTYVQSAIRVIKGVVIKGWFTSPVVISPYPVHFMMLEVVRLIPSRLIEWARLREQRSMHDKYMRKLAAKQ